MLNINNTSIKKNILYDSVCKYRKAFIQEVRLNFHLEEQRESVELKGNKSKLENLFCVLHLKTKLPWLIMSLLLSTVSALSLPYVISQSSPQQLELLVILEYIHFKLSLCLYIEFSNVLQSFVLLTLAVEYSTGNTFSAKMSREQGSTQKSLNDNQQTLKATLFQNSCFPRTQP